MTAFNTPLEGALYCAHRGWKLFPLAAGTKDTPVGKGPEKKASSDEKKIRDWATKYPNCNWALYTGVSGLAVIDIDQHNEDGFASFEEWKKEVGGFPRTFQVQTPSGGFHLYYKAEGVQCATGVRPGIDVRGKGGYVVAPGSFTTGKTGGVYTIVFDGSVAELPSNVNLHRTTKKPASKTAPESAAVNLHVTPDSELNIQLATTLLRGCPETFEGGRNDALNQLMWRICRCGVTAEKAEELYYEHARDRLHYGYDDTERKEIHNTILSAYGDMSIFGVDSPEAMFYAPVTAEDNKPHGFAELRAREVPPRKWLIQDWIYADPGSVFMLSGQGGTGKSLLALQLANALATGEPWLGMAIEHRAKTFFVTCEDSEDEVARRIQRVDHASRTKQKDDSLVKVWCRQGMNNIIAEGGRGKPVKPGPFFPVLKQACSEHFGQDGGILILDTLSDFVAIDENSRTEVSQFIKHILSQLGQELGVCTLLLAHPNKTNQGYSGSTAWEGSVRARWELEWKDQKVGDPLVLRLAKSNASMGGKSIVLEYGPDFLPRVAPEGATRDTFLKTYLYEQIRDYLEAGNPLGKHPQATNSIRGLAIWDPDTNVKFTPDEISSAVSELIAEKRVKEITENKKHILTIVEA